MDSRLDDEKMVEGSAAGQAEFLSAQLGLHKDASLFQAKANLRSTDRDRGYLLLADLSDARNRRTFCSRSRNSGGPLCER